MDKEYIYCTAILTSTKKLPYEQLLDILGEFMQTTQKEEGCIAFTVAPMSPQKQEIALWEIWENEKAFKEHMGMPYTVKLLGRNLVELRISESSRKVNS